MENKTKFYLITGSILLIVVLYFVFFFKKQVGGLPQGSVKSNAPKTTNTTTTNPDGSPLSDAQKGGIDTSAPPIVAADAIISNGAYVYAGEPLQTYTTCVPSQSTIADSFKAGDYIGKYMETQPTCIKTSVDTYYTFLWLDGYRSVPTGSKDLYIPITKGIYYAAAPPYVQVAPINKDTGCDANCNDAIGVSCKDTVGC